MRYRWYYAPPCQRHPLWFQPVWETLSEIEWEKERRNSGLILSCNYNLYMVNQQKILLMESEKGGKDETPDLYEAGRFALGAFLANRKLFLRRNSNPLHQLPNFQTSDIIFRIPAWIQPWRTVLPNLVAMAKSRYTSSPIHQTSSSQKRNENCSSLPVRWEPHCSSSC